MRATITFEGEIPDGVSKKDAEAWIRFELKDLSELRISPQAALAIYGKELEPVYDTLLIDFDGE